MLLYLSRNETAALFDPVVEKIGIHIIKLAGNFALQEFVVNQMRKYSSCSYLCVDRASMQENDSDFIEALKSFQMMYNAKIIVVSESDNGFDSFARDLRNNGITDIIAANDTDEKLRQFEACLSGEIIKKVEPISDTVPAALPVIQIPKTSPKISLAEKIIVKESKDTEYRFDCINVEIGVVGATRRVGVTTFAMGFAHWLKAHGGTVCYMIINAYGHLDSIAETYGFMSEGDFNYTHDGVDYIVEGGPEIDYNFIIYDFGGITKEKIKAFKECDLHLLCGASEHLHEIVEFSKALRPIKAVKPHIITRPIHKDLERAFKKEVCDNPIIINKSENMLDFAANNELYKEFIKEYIVETQKRF